MSFNVALTGIAAAQKDLNVTANNIANVNTTGFKESRAEFADVYASSVFSSSKTKSGDGVQTTTVAQQFHQGSLNFTQNSLDLAISGEGYFATSNGVSSQEFTYTRAGAFKLNKDNYVVDAKGNYLQAFPVDPDTGDTTSVSLSTSTTLQIPDTSGTPRPTSNVYTSFNVDSRDDIKLPAFDATDSTTYNSSTSTTVYDSLGEPHVMQFFFKKTAPNEWEVHGTLDKQPFDAAGNAVTPPATSPLATFGFDASGVPATTNGTPISTSTFDDVVLPSGNLSGLLSNGAQFPKDVEINWRDQAGDPKKIPSQYASKFEVKALEQDGATVGRLSGIEVGVDGKVVASYSNSDTSYLGQVAMVRFPNSQGLEQVGNSSWKKSNESGEPVAGEANSGSLGKINSSALEQSNVNLTDELVDLISAQRNFQASSRALEVNSTLQQNILQIR